MSYLVRVTVLLTSYLAAFDLLDVQYISVGTGLFTLSVPELEKKTDGREMK